MKKCGLALLCFLLLGGGFAPAAWAQELQVGGQAVGIRIQAEGVLVAGVGPVETAEGSRRPAEEAGVQQGDFIVALNGAPLHSAGALIDAVAASGGETLTLTVLRDEQELALEVRPALSAEAEWKLGMWLRDGITGVGTLTFYDPATGIYGALGHSISDGETGVVIPLAGGSISPAEIVSVTKGSAGAPGELNGVTDGAQSIGTVERNSGCGIYGHLAASGGGAVLETGQLHTGPASLLCTCQGGEICEYSLEISRLYRDSAGEHVLLRVTDPALLELTGGIVQGMSGSPILQDGRLVGAVTHVFVNDPTKGYGISIQDMLDAAGLATEEAA